jgi:SAM-dependent methyltransferase
MTKKYDTEKHQEQPVPASSEAAYDRLTGYGFARRYVRGKIVADVGWEEIGYGSRLLAETAESVVGLTHSPETVEQASAIYSAPNVNYQRVSLSELPYSEGYFDAMVAFGVVENLEHPEDLVREAKRVLKEDGVLVVSVLDKQANTNDRDRGGVNGRRGMYVTEFRKLLEQRFGHVHVYRQGAVAGGFIFPASEELTDTPVTSVRFSLANPDLDTEPPTTRSVVAVCSDAEVLGQEEQPYLLLDRDRRVFDESEERAEDVELMRGEIRQMQETEVQSFMDALKVQQSLAVMLRRYPLHALNVISGHLYHIKTESRMYRRLATPYRLLRGRHGELESIPESTEGSNTHRHS